jgi:hypothetical protein
VTVTAAVPGFRTTTQTFCVSATTPIVLALERTARITGVVRDDATNRPIESFRVRLEPSGAVQRYWSPNGGFVLDPADVESFAIEAQGWLPSAPRAIGAVPADDSHEIALTRVGGVYGRVLGPSGASVGGIEMRITDLSHATGPVQRITSTDGEFEFEPLAAGAYRAEVLAGGEALAAAEFRIVDPAVGTRVDLMVAQLPTVHVLVFRTDGTPCVGARSVFVRSDAGAHRYSSHTDEDGYAKLANVVPGRYLIATRSGAATTTTAFEIRMSVADPVVQVTLPEDQR